MKPFFITIDTEGDNLWANPKNITTENLKFLPRFQSICEKYNFYPIYLTNWECSNDKIFVKIFKELQNEGKCEIGMHLHAWNNPPIIKSKNTKNKQPFLIEFNKKTISAKIDNITKKLEDEFEMNLVSHRAGRWAINEIYLSILTEFNYSLDCSYTPYINWSEMSDDYKNAGVNYSHIKNMIYEFSENNKKIKLLPTTIIKNPIFYNYKRFLPNFKMSDKILGKLHSKNIWLRPNKNNLNEMLRLVDYSVTNNFSYLMFILHSSELMPGGSPTFKTKNSIEKLYYDIEILFEHISNNYFGSTFRTYLKN